MIERIVAVLSGLLTIILSLLTIYTFKWDKGKKKTNKLALLVTTIILIVVTICIFTIPKNNVKNPEPQTGMQNQDTLTKKASPVVNNPKPIEKKKEIERLVREARKLKGISTAEALRKFREAYDMLPETQKDERLIKSMEGYTDYGTRINLFDDYFKTQNY